MTRPRDDLDREDLIRRYRSGESLSALAKSVGASQKAVERQLVLGGQRIRSQSEAGRLRAARDPEATAAHVRRLRAANTGRIWTDGQMASRSAARQQRQLHIGVLERELGKILIEKGMEVVPQQAVGRYNIDLAVGRLAVEVHTGTHSPTLRRERATPQQRIEAILDAGYWPVYLWCPQGLGQGDVQNVVALAQCLSSNPPPSRQHLVIRCQGDR